MREERKRKEREALRRSHRGEAYDAQGKYLGDIHQIENNQYRIYLIEDGQILAMSIQAYRGQDFIADGILNLGYGTIKKYRIKEES